VFKPALIDPSVVLTSAATWQSQIEREKKAHQKCHHLWQILQSLNEDYLSTALIHNLVFEHHSPAKPPTQKLKTSCHFFIPSHCANETAAKRGKKKQHC
jgi:hypothetical protein